MLNPIELKFKVDKDSKTVFRTEKTIASHDINSVEFHISFDGLELTDTHIVKVLTSFHSSKSQTNVECEIVDGKAIYKPDTSLISRYEQVTCYIYVYHGNQSLAVRDFTYSVDVSKIDETTIRVREVYDQSYARVLLDFEQALQNYKDTLPQADSVRAEIDEILNQFSEDSQVKLNQFDTDAQQAIADWRVENSGELTALEAEIAKKANKQQEDWITPTLLNGWITNDGVYPPISFMKDDFGFVHLRGHAIDGTASQIFVLPSGYRPSHYMMFDIRTVFGPTTIITGVTVSKHGQVTIDNYGDGRQRPLNGIYFKAV